MLFAIRRALFLVCFVKVQILSCNPLPPALTNFPFFRRFRFFLCGVWDLNMQQESCWSEDAVDFLSTDRSRSLRFLHSIRLVFDATILPTSMSIWFTGASYKMS